jgi:hypothetical protein
MTRFTSWLSNTSNTLKNVGSKVGAFMVKQPQLKRTVGNAMSYLPGKIGEIGKAINYYSGMVDSFTKLITKQSVKR